MSETPTSEVLNRAGDGMSGRDVVADLRGAAEVLDSAQRYGLPAPFSVSATDYAPPRFQVHSAADWVQWRDYLEDPGVELRDTSGEQLWLTGHDQDFAVEVVACVAEGEGAQYVEPVASDA